LSSSDWGAALELNDASGHGKTFYASSTAGKFAITGDKKNCLTIDDNTGKMSITGNVAMYDHDVQLRGQTDQNHGFGWYGPGKPWTEDSTDGDFPTVTPRPDGPVIYGWAGGALGTMQDGQKGTALRWRTDGSVSVSGNLSAASASFASSLGASSAEIGFVKIDWNLDVGIIKSSFLNLIPKFPSRPMYDYGWEYLSNDLWDVPEGVRIINQGYTGPPWVIYHNALDATDDYSLAFIHQRDPRKGRSGVSQIAFLEDGSVEISGYLKIGSNWAGKPGGGEWTDTCDERLKTNIRPLTGALTNLLKLQGITYEWKEPEKHGDLAGTQIGFIGQAVEKVFPEGVSTDREGYKLLSIRGFSALSVEAFRELKNLCDDLRTRLDGLELRQSAG